MFLGGLSRNNVDSHADYKDVDGVILVYDITNCKSFDCITLCLEELNRHAKKRQAIILIGNKSDSENDREVLRKEARGFVEKNNLIFWEISALEGTNFDNDLKDLLKKLVNINSNSTTNNTTNTTNNNNTTTSTTTCNNTTNTTTTSHNNNNAYQNNGSNNWNPCNVNGDSFYGDSVAVLLRQHAVLLKD
ncbi:putative Ras-related protein RABA4e [Quercus robur]|uniref:putative Ras-related protein RABA4e n=1 Tax=Quercus robur TaxID=38942 RepID=UPI00216221BC|nr:putative Ras-related protein RABA4e [Quercus robur]